LFHNYSRSQSPYKDYIDYLFHFDKFLSGSKTNIIEMDPELVRSATEFPLTIDVFAEGTQYEKVNYNNMYNVT